jgi:hypothetical protein
MGKGKKPEVVSGDELCKCSGCKKAEARFTFCEEHYEWFKFGLISKKGQKVSDFDRKWDHYIAYLANVKAHKAA